MNTRESIQAAIARKGGILTPTSAASTTVLLGRNLLDRAIEYIADQTVKQRRHVSLSEVLRIALDQYLAAEGCEPTERAAKKQGE